MTGSTTTATSLTEAASAMRSARELADLFMHFLATGEVADGLFAPDMFGDISLPAWRLQGTGRDAVLAIRREGHPHQGTVPRHRFDPTPTGFVLEWEESWQADGQQWYCREMCRADISEDGIRTLSVYCTGDWDEARVAEHRAAVTLAVP